LIDFSAVTARQEQLANHKAAYSGYHGDRPSPQWPVSKGAQSATSSSRVDQLAMAKSLHGDYQHER
jgi:hypothetical protein